MTTRNPKQLIFDLDGTISDPKTGIVQSANYALEAFGFPTHSEADIAALIGPPLDHTLAILSGSTDATQIQQLVDKYRERYGRVGYAENVLYSGMPELIRSLHADGRYHLLICTSKRADFARRILDRFSLLSYFDEVDGGDVGIEKWQQLQGMLKAGIISQHALMIGDRAVDIEAAHRNGLKAAGVTWGYGSPEELRSARAEQLFATPDALSALLLAAH